MTRKFEKQSDKQQCLASSEALGNESAPRLRLLSALQSAWLNASLHRSCAHA
jgi:hypothetical protein